jgi:mannose-6-phosphate isomerase-like protein (cupin superfamily)
LKGTKKMKSAELFRGFSIGAGKDRFNDGFRRQGTKIDCKVSSKDTGGAMCVLEVNNQRMAAHVNQDQDEWLYVVDGDLELEIGKKPVHPGTCDSMFTPDNTEHAWTAVRPPAGIFNTYQPASKIEDIFRALAKFKDLPTREQRMRKATPPTDRRTEAGARSPRHDCVTGPPLNVDSNGR